jgi:hypothetical protein
VLDKRKFLIVWREGEDGSWGFYIEHLPLRGGEYLVVAHDKIWKSLVKRGVIA